MPFVMGFSLLLWKFEFWVDRCVSEYPSLLILSAGATCINIPPYLSI